MTEEADRPGVRSETEQSRPVYGSVVSGLRCVGPGAWQGVGFYVWDTDPPEAESWARTLAGVAPGIGSPDASGG